MKIKIAFIILGVLGVFDFYGQEIPSKTLEFDYMDLSVAPSDDFYQYATGTWMKNNPVPEEESRWRYLSQYG